MTDLVPGARTARKQLSNITVTDKEASQKGGRVVLLEIPFQEVTDLWPS